jgi:hypothetical protein
MLIVQQLAFLSVLHGCLLFQSQAAAGRGSISGVVRDSISGAPLPNVKVSAAGGTSTTTDPQGRYTLRGLKPGTVEIGAMIRDALGPATKVVGLLDGQDLTGVDIRVPNLARVSGIVTGEDEKPLAGITVHLVGRNYVFGALRYVYFGSATTDEGGRYVLPHVPPAHEILLLARREAVSLKPVSDAPSDPELRAPVLAPTYYLGAKEIGAAAALILGPGENRESVDIKMARSPSYCVSGTVRSDTGSRPVEFRISETQPVGLFGLAILDVMATHRVSDNVIRSGPSDRGTAGPDGKVRICGLHPGSYELSADSGDGFGVKTIVISDHDIGDVLVVAEPAVPVSGEIVWDGGAPDASVEDRATVLYGPTRRGSGLLTSVAVPIPGPFKFPEAIFKDDYIVSVGGLPEGVYLKDAIYGGRSIRNAFFNAGTGAQPPVIRFVLARDGGRVAAMVSDDEGKPVCDADVALMPANADSEAALASVITWGRTDSYGAWTSGAIAPGKYYVIAGFLPVDRSPDSIGKLWRARTKTEAAQIEVDSGAMVQIGLHPAEVE